MSDFQDFLKKIKKCPPEEKIHILRPESLRLLNLAQGYSTLVFESLNEGNFEETVEEMRRDMEKVIASLENLHDLIDAVTT
jgi:hypothetical protein